MWCLLKRHLIRLIRSEMCNRVISLSKKHQIEYLWLTQNVFIFSHCAHSTLVFFCTPKKTNQWVHWATYVHCTYLCFLLFIPNKFNLNCLQPAHALDTRQPHLRFNTLLGSLSLALHLYTWWFQFVVLHCIVWIVGYVKCEYKAHQLHDENQSVRSLWCDQCATLWADFD